MDCYENYYMRKCTVPFYLMAGCVFTAVTNVKAGLWKGSGEAAPPYGEPRAH